MQPTRWERLRGATGYPLLWIIVYAGWLGFLAVLLFWFLAISPPSLAVGLLVGLGLLPFALLSLSHWMLRVYNPDRPR